MQLPKVCFFQSYLESVVVSKRVVQTYLIFLQTERVKVDRPGLG